MSAMISRMRGAARGLGAGRAAHFGRRQARDREDRDQRHHRRDGEGEAEADVVGEDAADRRAAHRRHHDRADEEREALRAVLRGRCGRARSPARRRTPSRSRARRASATAAGRRG